MPLSSASTLAEVYAQYCDSADYFVGGDTAKCQAFILACQFLLLPKFSVKRMRGQGGGMASEVEIEPTLIQHELKNARAWLAASGGGNQTVMYSDFTGFRGE